MIIAVKRMNFLLLSTSKYPYQISSKCHKLLCLGPYKPRKVDVPRSTKRKQNKNWKAWKI